MDEKKRKRLVYAALIGAIVFALIMRPWEGRKRRHPDMAITTQTAPANQPAAVESGGRPAASAAVTNPVPVTFATSWPQDPFRQTSELPISSVGANARTRGLKINWNLQGILTVDNQSVCLFDGQMYEIGSIINGWEIIYIGTNAVHLHRDGETVSLTLPQTGT
jgi:hypothetical protein